MTDICRFCGKPAAYKQAKLTDIRPDGTPCEEGTYITQEIYFVCEFHAEVDALEIN